MSEPVAGFATAPQSGQKRKLITTDNDQSSTPPGKRQSREGDRDETVAAKKRKSELREAGTESVSTPNDDVSSAGSDHRTSASGESQSPQVDSQHAPPPEETTHAVKQSATASCFDWEESFAKIMPSRVVEPGERQPGPVCLDWEDNYYRTAPSAGLGHRGQRDGVPRASSDDLERHHGSEHSNEERAASAHSANADVWDESEAERLVDVLLSNIEWRRYLRALSSKISNCQRKIKLMEESKGGVHDILARVKVIRDLKTKEAEAEMRRAKADLERYRQSIAKTCQLEEMATRDFRHTSKEQRRRDARLFGFASDLAFSAGSLLHNLPPSVFVGLRDCEEAAQRTRTTGNRMAELREEERESEHGMEELMVRLIRLRRQQSPSANAEALKTTEAELAQFKKSNKLSDLIKRQEDLSTQIEQATRAQSQKEDSLYAIVEQSLVTGGLLPSEPGCAMAFGGGALSSNAAQIPATGEEQLACGTPMAASPERPSDATRKAARLATETSRRLKAALRAEFNFAHAELGRCEQALDGMHTEIAPGPEGHSTEAREERGRAYFLEKGRRTRELMNAEEVFDGVLRRAQDAGLVGIEARSEGFSSHASDGYLESEVRAHVSRLDHSAVEAWMKHAEEAGAPGSGDPKLARAGERTDDADLVPVIVETDADLEDIMPLEIGESFSVVACDKRRLQIDRIMDQRQQDGDGFRRRRRGSI